MEDNEIANRFKQCKTVEELKNLAKEFDYELSDEEAKAYLDSFSKSGELSDDELSNVNGGCAKWRNGKAYSGVPNHKLIVTLGNRCSMYDHFPLGLGIKGTCCHCRNIYKHPRDKNPFTVYCMERTYYNDPLNPYK